MSNQLLLAADRIVEQVQISSIQPTPANWTIYRKPDLTDQTFADLCQSIRDTGINTPLEISRDSYIISGHRRYLAAKEAGLESVPCLTDWDVVMATLSSSERIAILTERNKGVRIKSSGELYLEAAAAVDPEQAIREARARKANFFDRSKKSGMTEVETTGSISRTDPSGERRALLAAVLEILEEKRSNGYLPTSGRHIHYSLLSKKVRTSPRSNGYIYGTRPGSAGLLSKLLTDARSAGLIHHGDINDSTRPSEILEPSGTVGQYVNKKLGGLFKNYFFDVHHDQSNHVEILVEKNTVFPLLVKHVANPLRVTITSLHGYGSFPAARDVAQRFKESGKEKLVVIYVSDLDPEGVDMAASWKKYLEHDFGIKATVFRAAVTPEQVKKYNLPPDADVKLTSTRAKRFIELYGDQCWELDSMPEEILIEEVSQAVRAQLDIPALNAAFALEGKADVELAYLAAKVRAFVTDTYGRNL